MYRSVDVCLYDFVCFVYLFLWLYSICFCACAYVFMCIYDCKFIYVCVCAGVLMEDVYVHVWSFICIICMFHLFCLFLCICKNYYVYHVIIFFVVFVCLYGCVHLFVKDGRRNRNLSSISMFSLLVQECVCMNNCVCFCLCLRPTEWFYWFYIFSKDESVYMWMYESLCFECYCLFFLLILLDLISLYDCFWA